MPRFLLFIFVACFGRLLSQVGAPVLHCVSVINAAGDVTLTWSVPPDPMAQFTSYKLYSSFLQNGTYTPVTGGTINTYSQSAFTDVGAGANIQAKYYYIVTVSNGTVTSAPSDTMRSIFLNINGAGGVASLTWNATHTPLLASASTQYTVTREYPPGTWTTLYTGPSQSYKDTISICSVFYNYRVETSDNLPCTSQSNISGGTFSDFTSPKLPFFDSVSVDGAGNTVFGWEPSGSPDTKAYVIYKQFSGVWTPIDTVFGINNTSYTYTNSTSGSGSENYCIAALDSCKNISPLGTNQTTIHVDAKYDACSRSAVLAWNAYSNLPGGVLEYEICSSENGGAYTIIGTTTSLSYTQAPLMYDTAYCYIIRVKNVPGDITSSSNKACITATGNSGPAYIYLKSVSVNPAQAVDISYIVDNTRPCRGVKLFRSLDGIDFSLLASNTNTTNGSFTDTDVHCKSQNYYYKLVVLDTCGNDGVTSNTSKTIVMSVKNDNANIFLNNLSWDAYSTWLGGVDSYNIYRAVNGAFDPNPVANVPAATRSYTDDVSGFTEASGKFTYYVEALEGPSNPYGLQASSRSNTDVAYAEVTVFVPSAFSPKGINAVWLPVAQYVEKTDYKVMVFNRWGAKVFETSSDTQGWSGSNATDDIYAYLIQYKNSRGEFTELKGTVMLLR